MNDVLIFENPELGTVRALTIDEEPWFVGRDVAEILGYSNTRDALSKHVDDEDKRDGVAIRDAIGREQYPTLVNESGVYALVFGSRLPGAKKFKHWVTHEVLPAVRRHGVYATDELIANPDLAIAAFTALKEEREKNRLLSETVAVQNQQITEMRPKASYYDVVLNCKDLVAISVIAKDYGWSARRMNEYLHCKGIQYRQGNIWLLYQKHAEKGFTSTKTHSYLGNDGDVHTKVHTYWTQKGRLFIYDLLKSDGFFPLIER